MAKKSNTVKTTTWTNPTEEQIKAGWEKWRADRILELMNDADEPYTYREAVKWSRRFAKREGAWTK